MTALKPDTAEKKARFPRRGWNINASPVRTIA
jgi:hypothetical protein